MKINLSILATVVAASLAVLLARDNVIVEPTALENAPPTEEASNFEQADTEDSPYRVNLSIEDRYQELEKEYGNYMGVSLSYCSKLGVPSLYTLEYSSGFTGGTYYYDKDGKELSREEWSDVNLGDPLFVDIETYNCKVIKETEGYPHE